jgi:hypothetical protein
MDGLQPQLNFAPLLLMIWMTSTIISLHCKRRTPFAPGSKRIVEIVDNYPANEPFLREAIERPRRLTRPQPSFGRALAFELNLQDFSRQANQAGLGQVRRAVGGGPKLLFRLRLTAIHTLSLHFDA